MKPHERDIWEYLNNILTLANWTNIYRSHNRLSTGSQKPLALAASSGINMNLLTDFRKLSSRLRNHFSYSTSELNICFLSRASYFSPTENGNIKISGNILGYKLLFCLIWNPENEKYVSILSQNKAVLTPPGLT